MVNETHEAGALGKIQSGNSQPTLCIFSNVISSTMATLQLRTQKYPYELITQPLTVIEYTFTLPSSVCFIFSRR